MACRANQRVIEACKDFIAVLHPFPVSPGNRPLGMRLAIRARAGVSMYLRRESGRPTVNPSGIALIPDTH